MGDLAANSYAEDILVKWALYLFKEKNSIKDFKNYLKEYPKGKYELAAKFYLVLSHTGEQNFKTKVENILTSFPFSYYSQILAQKRAQI